MGHILIDLGVTLAVIVAAICVYASSRPDSFRIQRSAAILAPPEKIYAMVEDFHRWATWSPWEKLDPGMERTYGGAEHGLGASYAWESAKAGQGRMEITEVVEPTRVVIKLDFIKPFEAHNIAEFTLTPKGDATVVTWTMSGPSPFISKLMGLAFNMDKVVGKDFATGLANLKAAAEA